MNEVFRRRHLPHWDVPGATYFVTACLSDSIPAAGLRRIDELRGQLDARPRPPAISEADWDHRNRKLVFAKLDELLDREPAVRHFDNPAVASVVRAGVYHFAGFRYRSLAYVIMPSHLHWLFQPLPNWCETLPAGRTPREAIMHGLKSYTANLCNRVLGRAGRFWQDESYDHWVRDDDELERIAAYIENNPVKAGLATEPADYLFSSAHDRNVGRASSLS